MTIIGTGTAPFYERSVRGMTGLRAQAERMQSRIGTGERLARSSDDPVAAARLRTLARVDRMAQIDATNANRAAVDLSLADDALTSFAEAVMRAQTLANQAANDTLNDTQRAAIAAELSQIHGQLVDLANARDSMGHALFGGAAAGPAYELDASGNAVYIGTAASGELPLGDGQAVTRGLTGPEFLNFAVGGSSTDLLAVVRTLADGLQGADPAQAARDALGALSQGLDKVATGQTIVGARLAWLDLAAEQRLDRSELRGAEQADIGGVDFAATFARLQNTLLVLEASQSSFAKLSSLSLFARLG
ncbi:MAG: flagellar biosynthesis protein FlgL [Novosphingobium sp.]|nr:flagellar biosynthesis protein FlgL [Novosphingobium sp.]